MDSKKWLFRQYLDLFFIVSIEDILIYSRNKEESVSHLRIILHTLEDHQLFAKYSKCEVWWKSVAILGQILSSEGIRVY